MCVCVLGCPWSCCRPWSPSSSSRPEQHKSVPAPPLPTPCSCISSRRRGTKLASHGRAQQSVCIVWIVQYQNVLLYFSSAFFPLRVIECLWDFWECRLLIPCILLLTVLLHVSYLWSILRWTCDMLCCYRTLCIEFLQGFCGFHHSVPVSVYPNSTCRIERLISLASLWNPVLLARVLCTLCLNSSVHLFLHNFNFLA